jgi:valyl-tRNA synthetase
MPELPSTYQPQPVEQRWYHMWESRGYFRGDATSTHDPYTIVIPPPNVTGILHMGHALNNTIQDILIRWQRMRGRATLWVPGTDHAGIATQNVVERKLAKEGKQRHDLGRDAFLQQVWAWKEEHGNTIINQLKRLGASCDWGRTRFTMDEGLSGAVREVFVQLYEEGLVYRGNYIVNWCPHCETALSDEEAPHKEQAGKLYYIRYPLVDSDETILIATTRPETLLGDTAIAVNPSDARYTHVVGKHTMLPIVQRTIPIIADDFVDPAFGTGAVKVTPAHDPNDFAMGKRHTLEVINIMTSTAHMEHVPKAYAGQDRLECRQALLKDLARDGLLERTEEHQHAVGHCYRCDTMVEPRLSLQWFVKMAPLAKPALEASQAGTIRFYPERWTKVYNNWMENIHDWCISRQIWWGHRIPVWYCDVCLSSQCDPAKRAIGSVATQAQGSKGTPGIIVQLTPPKQCPTCNSITGLHQDEDVLDTWFSSWLWPFSTLGWPVQTAELRKFYPTSTLVTAPEILFFWVARMVMSGIHFMDAVPFTDIYLHGTVRDLTGKKMSKSLGNIIDPLDIIERFGCDALRFSLVTAQSVGTDLFIGDEKFVVGRNFGNKLWNVTRFVLASVPRNQVLDALPPVDTLDPIDQWILSRLQSTITAVDISLTQYRLSEAAMQMYDFIWRDYCDWYVELAKSRLQGDGPHAQMTATILVHVLETALRLLHPIMPFVTEELWQHVRAAYHTLADDDSIMMSAWPAADTTYVQREAEQLVDLSQRVIAAVRNMRADFQIPPTQEITLRCASVDQSAVESIQPLLQRMSVLARIDSCDVVGYGEPATQSAQTMVGAIEVTVPLAGIIDLDKERARLTKQRDEVSKHLAGLTKRLASPQFIDRAPEDVVAKERARATTLQGQQESLERYLAALS